MGKLVYLFELDSFRNKDFEIKKAINALYRQIAVYGNTVVVTYNQLVDSRCMLSMLNDPKWADKIVKLFQLGAIRISQFRNIRTPSQYLLEALDWKREFIFSGLPLKSSQKSLLALAKRSLMYSDLTELKEYREYKKTGLRTEADLKQLLRLRFKKIFCTD